MVEDNAIYLTNASGKEGKHTKWSSRRLLNILSIIIYLHSPAVDVLTGKKKISAKNELNLVLLKKKNSVRKDWNIKQKHLPPFCLVYRREQRQVRSVASQPSY